MITRPNLPHTTLFMLAAFNIATAAADTPTDNSKPGYTAGGFRILPEVEAVGYYDDNVYATKRSKVSDAVAVVTPKLSAESQWERHRLDLGAGASVGRYLDTTDEDYEDLWLSAEGRYDLSAGSRLNGGVGYSRNHEPRDSKENAQQQGVDEPTTYDVVSLQAGYDQRFGDTDMKLGLTRESVDYSNVGTLYNDDRDRAVSGIGLRVAQAVGQRESLYVQAIANRRDYTDARDQYGYARDSKGYNAVVGFSRKSEAGIDRKLATDLLGYLNYNQGSAEFQDVGREDDTRSISAGVKYFMSPKVMLTGSYSYINNDSNDRNTVVGVSDTYDYTRNLFFLTIKVRLAP
ncbi:MAG: outer membrane beta-barrel protein [Candidatus Thiodiazotropha sp.]